MQQPPTTELASAVRELAWPVVRETTTSDLSRTAAGTLSALERHGPLRISDLTRREAVLQPAMTSLVQRLETAGLVSRSADPDDGRAVRIAVTEAGRAALQARRHEQDAVVAARLDRLHPDRRRALEAALDAVVALTEEDHEPV